MIDFTRFFTCIFALSFFFTSPVTLANGGNDSIQYQLLWDQSTFPDFPLTIAYDNNGRNFFYVAGKDGGLRIYDASNVNSPSLAETLPASDFQGLHVMDVAQQGNFLYLALGNFFGNNTQEPGVAIVDVSTPATPTITDIWKAPAIQKGSSEIRVEGTTAYLGAMNQGVMLFDVADVNVITHLSTFLPDPDYPIANPAANQEPNARGMAVRNDTIFLANDAGGFWIIDATNKQQPSEVSRYLNSGALNTQQAYNNVTLNGNLAYIGEDYCGLEILDFSDPTNIQQVSWWNPWGCETLQNIWINSPGHTNQVEHIANQDLLFISAGGSELIALDVSDPTQPVACNSIGATDNQQGAWSVAVHQNLLFLGYIHAIIPFTSNFTGIRLYNWENPNGINPVESSLNFSVQPNFPNPFHSETMFRFHTEINQQIQIDLLDLTGKIIQPLANQTYPAGNHTFLWDNSTLDSGNMASGIYFVRFTAGGRQLHLKVLKH